MALGTRSELHAMAAMVMFDSVEDHAVVWGCSCESETHAFDGALHDVITVPIKRD